MPLPHRASVPYRQQTRYPELTRQNFAFPSTSSRKHRTIMADVLLEEEKKLIEESKRRAAIQAVDEHFDPTSSYIGIGSGTTIIFVVEAIKEKLC